MHLVVFLKIRICRKFPLDLRYRSTEFLGLELEDLFITQRCKKLAFFIEERIGSSLSSSFVRSNYEWVLIYIRVGNQELLGLNYEKWSCLLLRV